MGTPTKQQTEDVLLEVGKWTEGVVNARPGKDISKNALQDALNVDITDAGTVSRRKGFKLEVGGQKCHSAYSDGSFIYHVDGPSLYRSSLNQSWTTSVVRSDLTVGAPLFWTSAQGVTWYSNGFESGKLVDGVPYAFTLEQPSAQPMVAVASGGTLPPGHYGIAVSFIALSGEESGTLMRTTVQIPPNRDANGVDLPPSGLLSLTKIPQPTSLEIGYIRIYCTDANGTVPYKYADMPVGTTSLVVARSRTKGMPLMNEMLDQFPACRHLHAWRGYMVGSQGNILWHSEPQRFGLTQLGTSFIPFESEITMIAPVDDGIYVATKGRTYFLDGAEPSKWSRREVLPYGDAAQGTYVRHPTKVEALWWMNGQIRGGIGGNIRNETIERIAPKKYGAGASLFRREDGIEQIVNSFPESGDSEVMSASSFTDAEIIRAIKT